MKQSPKVFVVVLNYNGRDVLDQCLSGLFRQDYPNFSVILVDNASTDGSLEAAKKKFSRGVFIKNETNLGFSAGNNVGIRFSLERGAQYVFLLNNDTEIPESFLTDMVTNMESRSALGIASPIVLAGKAEEVWFSGGKIDWWRMKTIHFRDFFEEKFRSSEFISGCAMVVKREVFLKAGLLDEEFFLYWEDADFSFRAARAGFERGVFSDVKIRHFEKSEKKKPQKVYWLVVSGLLFFKKNSSFWRKKWVGFYVFLRRIKNWRDARKSGDEICLKVKKAYADFSKYGKG